MQLQGDPQKISGFQSAFAGEWLKKHIDEGSTWHLDIEFQSAFAGEWLKKKKRCLSPHLHLLVSIRFRWRMAEEEADQLLERLKAETVSIRFRWRMAEEVRKFFSPIK